MPEPSFHLSKSILIDYVARRLPVADSIAASDHLAACSLCREEAVRLQERPDAAQAIRLESDETTLRQEEMEALLNGSLDAAQAEAVAARLQAFTADAGELDDLRALHAEMAALPPATYGPKVHALSAPRKIIPWPFRQWVPVAAAAALILFASGWWLHRAPPLWTGADGHVADISALPEGLRDAVLKAARLGVLDRPSIPAAIHPPAGVLAGAGEEASAAAAWQLSPVGAVVREQRPRLRWAPREGATNYVIYLKALANGRSLTHATVPGGQSEWMPPQPLTRGGQYEWQIEARHDGEIIDQAPRPPAPEARFQILDDAQASGLDEVERRYAGNPLILGTAYARAGLDEPAAWEFKALARLHPESAAARALSRSYQ